MQNMAAVLPTITNRSLTAVDTSAFNKNERFPIWREVVSTMLSPSENSLVSSAEDFFARFIRVPLGTIEISMLESAPIRSVRTSNLLRTKPDDDFFVSYMVSGYGELTQGGRHAVQRPGDVLIYDSARTFHWDLRENYSMLFARISRRLLTARLPDAEQLTARTLQKGEPFASLIGSTMTEIIKMHNVTGIDAAPRLSKSLIDVLASSLEFGLTSAEPVSRQKDLLARAKQMLMDNLENPDFDFQSLAKALSVAPRTLCRVFAADGTTAMKWLWQQRLQFALKLLTQGQVKSVSQVVMLSGFNDFSHFGRAFKAAFGVLPSEILRQKSNGDLTPGYDLADDSTKNLSGHFF